MPRYARELSSTGIYHIMLRGIDRMEIFQDTDDKIKFLEILQKVKKEGEYMIYAFCIMDNHVHLLIHEQKDFIQRSMKRICVSYSYYFNHKYNRIGHLFQDRFKSEAIEQESYILTCARYIHNNPVKAGIVQTAADYRWSSYRFYIEEERNSQLVDNKEFLLSMFSEDSKRAVALLRKFTGEDNADEFIDIGSEITKNRKVVTNSRKIILSILKKHNMDLTDIKTCVDKVKRNEILKEIKDVSGASVRELSSILGISKDIIFRS